MIATIFFSSSLLTLVICMCNYVLITIVKCKKGQINEFLSSNFGVLRLSRES